MFRELTERQAEWFKVDMTHYERINLQNQLEEKFNARFTIDFDAKYRMIILNHTKEDTNINLMNQVNTFLKKEIGLKTRMGGGTIKHINVK